ncbi:MAG: NTP transferase domain-containing protein [Alistipes sp.]|nr:NTP transferase domain-containing protein [Alistipes sp.]
MNSNRYCVIMAGGIGSRFWPMSRQSQPKQFLDILGTGRSFIRHTYDRFAKIIPNENFIVVTNRRYKKQVLEHLPELKEHQVLCEPIGRNTAPCIAYAAYTLRKMNPDAEMIVSPSDHLILNENEFISVVNSSLDFIQNNSALMTIGINPTRPETGYGYIQRSSNESISPVKCFTEKPNLEMAQAFLNCGEFLWNSGIFIWKVRDIIASFEQHLPEHSALFASIENALRTESEQEAIEQVFSECKPISIDYGIMEKADNVFVHSGDFGWSDVGTWGSVYQLSRKDKYANAASGGTVQTYDTRNSLISIPKQKVAVVSGLKDYIVVDTDDVLMICPKHEEQNIKSFIEDIKYTTGDKHI